MATQAIQQITEQPSYPIRGEDIYEVWLPQAVQAGYVFFSITTPELNTLVSQLNTIKNEQNIFSSNTESYFKSTLKARDDAKVLRDNTLVYKNSAKTALDNTLAIISSYPVSPLATYSKATIEKRFKLKTLKLLNL